jgi:hypothetical protein
VALLLSRSGSKAEAPINPRAARVERVDGRVGVASADDQVSENEWAEAELNTPLSVGDRIYADDDSHAAVALTGRNYARINPGSALDVLSLSDQRTQLALRSGSAIFDVGELADGELFEVATPHGAVDFYEPGLYQVGIGDDGSSMISVLSGLAQVVGLAGSGEIGRGEMLTLLGQTAAQVLLSRIAPDLAGGIVDDYYDYRYPDVYDGRYNDYDVYLDDPYYYDPYRNSVSYQYVPSHIAGAYDLDYYGDWVDIDGYGHCWSPRVEAGWSPYRQGYWETDEVWGPTWVSDEPWGWAPYHYGRWAHVNNRWVWAVEEARRSPVYAPALVAFVPMPQQQQIAWVPLGPGERYVPRYYDAGYEAHYLASPRVVREVVYDQRSFVNLNSPSALTVVPVDRFTGYIAPEVIVQPDPRLIAQASPTLDPFAFQSLRETVVSSKAERRRLKFERRLQREALNTPVVTSVAPSVLERRPELARALQFQAVSEKQKNRKLKIDDTGQVVAAKRADGLPQSPIARQQGPQVAGEAVNGAQTKRELKRIERQQRKQAQAQDQNAGRAVGLPQVVQKQATPATGTTSREVRKQQKRLDRQQRQAALGEQRRAILEQQAARKQQRRQVVQPQLPTVELKRQQRKAQRQAERQQRQLSAKPIQQQRSVYSAPQIRSEQQSQQIIKQQRKAERRAARQSAAVQQPRVFQPQVNQQPKVRQQQRVYQQPQYNSQPQIDRQQRKAQRQAERRAARQQQTAQQQVVVPQQTYRAPAQAGAASQTQSADKAQRRAEKQAARRAARGKGQHE